MEITGRVTLEGVLVLSAFDGAMKVFSRCCEVDRITGERRGSVEPVPEKAFREAAANALVHRTWDVNQYIQIGMFREKIEITSPGSLPEELSREDYLRGRVSVLRNLFLAGVFARPGIIESFGIRRINACCKSSLRKPEFEVYDNSVTVIFPRLASERALGFGKDVVAGVMSPHKIMTRAGHTVCAVRLTSL